MVVVLVTEEEELRPLLYVRAKAFPRYANKNSRNQKQGPAGRMLYPEHVHTRLDS